MIMVCLYGISFFSCNKDIPPEVSCGSTPQGQVCREDAFRRGEFLGYIEYIYMPDNKLYQKKYFSTHQSYLEETFIYNNKSLLVYKKGVDKEGNTTEENKMEHTEFDSLSSLTVIKNGASDGSIASMMNSTYKVRLTMKMER